MLLADDQRLVRAGLRLLLDLEPGLEVVGEAADGVEAVAAAQSVPPPDVVLMDVRMPRLDGIEATARIRRLPHAPQVLVLTTFDADELVYRALQAGACGFLLKDAPQEHLVLAVRAAAAGVPTVAPTVVARMVERFAGPAPATGRWPALDRLTARERDVLRAMATGASNADIARALHLGESTVKSHVAHVLTKLDLTSRSQAVVVAYESGLVARGA
ncbi:response regulator [Cellulomonas marina]|uniref:DNA-binding response regulator, NarL/FixJ family, contains REC and HTH domains n=1 Tax=Cellulomonas marina TaxID=988821 RepID=A0A1I1AL18_9CELL|nr:response regulator transcription factor [Cellulomonas marina]SFB37033.1 DNA-binding response regulator, NarL/FixJ family, contains REC and HTH domains [Cellulomonas marina]